MAHGYLIVVNVIIHSLSPTNFILLFAPLHLESQPGAIAVSPCVRSSHLPFHVCGLDKLKMCGNSLTVVESFLCVGVSMRYIIIVTSRNQSEFESKLTKCNNILTFPLSCHWSPCLISFFLKLKIALFASPPNAPSPKPGYTLTNRH